MNEAQFYPSIYEFNRFLSTKTWFGTSSTRNDFLNIFMSITNKKFYANQLVYHHNIFQNMFCKHKSRPSNVHKKFSHSHFKTSWDVSEFPDFHPVSRRSQDSLWSKMWRENLISYFFFEITVTRREMVQIERDKKFILKYDTVDCKNRP